MCAPISFVLTKERVFWGFIDNHSVIIKEHGLNEWGAKGPNIVRVELSPGANWGSMVRGMFTPTNTWVFMVDQDKLPEWYDAVDAEKRTRAALKECLAERRFSKKKVRITRDGDFWVRNPEYLEVDADDVNVWVECGKGASIDFTSRIGRLQVDHYTLDSPLNRNKPRVCAHITESGTVWATNCNVDAYGNTELIGTGCSVYALCRRVYLRNCRGIVRGSGSASIMDGSIVTIQDRVSAEVHDSVVTATMSSTVVEARSSLVRLTEMAEVSKLCAHSAAINESAREFKCRCICNSGIIQMPSNER